MKKPLSTKVYSNIAIALLGVGFLLIPQVASADIFLKALLAVPGHVSVWLLQLLSLILGIAGVILNFILDYTVVNMADNIKDVGINEIWRTVRDLANIAFIFVLLYAAIQVMLGAGSKVQETIRNVVIVALLMNFSLFFTKIIIDAANILAVMLYGAMAPGALSAGGIFDPAARGLSNSLMEPLKLSTIYGHTKGLDGISLLIIGIMGSIFVLIASFVFFAISILFVIRFVVLMFVLVLSPIAFISWILPNAKSTWTKWWNALSGQAFFAPIFFLLIWIVLAISSNLYSVTDSAASIGSALAGSSTEEGGKLVATPTADNVGLIFNFLVTIALLITSLVVAKDWANKAGPAVGNLTKWATGAAGNASFGLAGRAGRATIGRAGQAAADSRWLKERAPESRMARLALAAGKKTGAANFDARNLGATKKLDAGKASGKGGYRAQREEKVKGRMKQAEDFKDTITGDHVENEMTNMRNRFGFRQTRQLIRAGLTADQIRDINQNGLSKDRVEALGLNGQQAEAVRRIVQTDLIAGSDRESARRQELFLNNLSQTHWYTPNLYAGVSENAEAARRMRAGQKAESSTDKLKKILKDMDAEETPPTPPAGGTPPTTP